MESPGPLSGTPPWWQRFVGHVVGEIRTTWLANRMRADQDATLSRTRSVGG